jgi:nicotinamidase-related amidase
MSTTPGNQLPSNSDPAANDITLLCVDMQPVFIRAMTDGARVQRRCEFAIAAAVGLGIPVIFTEQVPEKLGGTAPEVARLAPGAPVLGKNTFSAFGAPAIRDAILRQFGTQHLLICGLETPVCVYQSAVAAIAESLEVTILGDAVGARRLDDARICLDALTHAGAHVLPAETVFYALLHDVTHPFFKAYTQLVKSHA